jgi:hypothetical protein
MQSVSDQAQQTITQVFTTFLSLMVKDVPARMNLYAEDADKKSRHYKQVGNGE